MSNKYNRIENIVRKKLSCSAHNFSHVMRVHNLSKRLAEAEQGIKEEILFPAVLLHDIARVEEDEDKSGKIDHAVLGAKRAESILKDLDYSKEAVKEIKHCIVSHRFRSDREPESKEAKILFDADKLDAIGAIGIARAYALAGRYGEKIYAAFSPEEYKQKNIGENGRIKDLSNHAPNIEYEVKLKKIPERLHTDKGKEIAQERINYMSNFFSRIEKEIKGEK